MCELLVGLPEVNVLGVEDLAGRSLRVHVESRVDQAWCRACGCRAVVKDRSAVALVDLPCFGRPARLVWHKHRWSCRERACPAGSWTVVDDRIAVARAALTDRAARWVTVQVGRLGRSVNEVADELGCDWHTVNDAVVAYGEALLDADVDRVGAVDALGLDETLFFRKGPRHLKQWCTSVVDAGGPERAAKLIEVVEGRTAAKVSGWLDDQPQDWRAGIRWGVLDMSGPYRKVFDDSLDHVTQVADPFHLVKHANSKLDECRRRVQNETLGHRGRKNDPLYRGRRLLTKGHERLDGDGEAKLLSLLEAGDPRGEVRMTWHAKETVRSLYDIDDPDLAGEFLDELISDMADADMPPEVRSLGRTLTRWRDHIVAWHHARVTNGPTEAINNLIKRIKRIGFGLRRFRHYRVRALLYAGRPNWDLLATITPR
ncbi:MAG: ISL3 family transposase [Actinomycetes bacterium]|jgi:transposase